QVTAVFVVFFTVAVKGCEPPSATVAVAGETVTVAGVIVPDPAFTVTAFRWLVTPPGFGLATVTFTVPTCAVVTVPAAVSEVAETKVVAIGTPPNNTVAPGTKFDPLMLSDTGPGTSEFG